MTDYKEKIVDCLLPPETAFDEWALQKYVEENFGLPAQNFRLINRSVDARRRPVQVQVRLALYANDCPPLITYNKDNLPDVTAAPEAIIVGAGPAGMFAALELIEQGIKPIVLERGNDVRTRRRDLAAINKTHIVNPESNYCFGEGGAGTYSDGKLYTRSGKRGNPRRILEMLVNHGATPQILADSRPHIGTNKLPGIVQALRETIIACGGVVRFNTKVTSLIVKNGQAVGVETNAGKISGLGIILATGHSANDIFEMLHQQKILIEAKPFAIGVRAEHPQSLIDKLQYKCESRGAWLPAAYYSLVTQTKVGKRQKGVFSFCMCPGGFIVPAATAPGQVVVNGMSPSRRNSRFANSGIVVTVDEQDYGTNSPLAGLYYQQKIEQQACQVAGNTQQAPAQRITDFLHHKVSAHLNETSYQPGLQVCRYAVCATSRNSVSVASGIYRFWQKNEGYVTRRSPAYRCREPYLFAGSYSQRQSELRASADKKPVSLRRRGRLCRWHYVGGYGRPAMCYVFGKKSQKLTPNLQLIRLLHKVSFRHNLFYLRRVTSSKADRCLPSLKKQINLPT